MKMVEEQTQEQLQAAEQARLQALFAPLAADKAAWEASFTEEEKNASEAYTAEMRDSEEKRVEFQQEVDSAFATSDADGDEKLTRDEFKDFVTRMNNHGINRGLKNRETNDEFIDMVYPAFDGFNQQTQGVSKGEILAILAMLNN